MHLCHQSMRAPKAKVPKPKELAQFICLLLVYIVITCLSDANGLLNHELTSLHIRETSVYIPYLQVGKVDCMHMCLPKNK